LPPSDRNSAIKPGASLKRLPHLPQNAHRNLVPGRASNHSRMRSWFPHWHHLRMASAFDAADEANSDEQRNNGTHRHRPRSGGTLRGPRGILQLTVEAMSSFDSRCSGCVAFGGSCPRSCRIAALGSTNSILAAFEMSLYCAVPLRQSLPTAFKKTVQTPPATRADRREARATERSCVRAPFRTPWPTGRGLFPPDLGGIDFAGVIAFAECHGLGPPQSHRNFWFFLRQNG